MAILKLFPALFDIGTQKKKKKRFRLSEDFL